MTAVILGLSSFLAAGYNLYLYSGTQHGNVIREVNRTTDGEYREHLVLPSFTPATSFFSSSDEPLVLS